MIVMLPSAIPGQLHLDPAVFVAVDFTVDGAGNHRVLITRQRRPRLLRQGRAEDHVPRSRHTFIAIPLKKISTANLGDSLLQNLRLPAFVGNVRHQPHVIPFVPRMPGQLEEPAAAQCRVIATGTGYSIVTTVPLQATLREVFAVGAIGKMTGVGLLLKPWKLFADHATLQHQARLEKVVVTQSDRGGAGFQPQRKALDGRRIRHHPGARHVGRRLIGRGENGLVIAKHQQMSFGRMLEVIVNPLLGTQGA